MKRNFCDHKNKTGLSLLILLSWWSWEPHAVHVLLQCKETLESQITVGCLQDGKAAGNQSTGPCARHQGGAVTGTRGSRAVVALLWCWGVQLLHFGGGSGCHPLSWHGTAPGNTLHLGRVGSEQSLAGAVRAPLWGPSGSPELCEVFGPAMVEGVMMKFSSAWVPRSLFTLVAQAFVISFTSDFIPRLVYLYMYSENGTMHGFVNHTLSSFNVSDFQAGTAPNDPLDLGYEVQICRYSLEWSLMQSVFHSCQILTFLGQVPCVFPTFFSTLLAFYIRWVHCLEYLAYILSNHRPEYDLLLILGNGD